MAGPKLAEQTWDQGPLGLGLSGTAAKPKFEARPQNVYQICIYIYIYINTYIYIHKYTCSRPITIPCCMSLETCGPKKLPSAGAKHRRSLSCSSRAHGMLPCGPQQLVLLVVTAFVCKVLLGQPPEDRINHSASDLKRAEPTTSPNSHSSNTSLMV